MKLAESLILDELINATDIDYEDVSKNRFWIVCPCCKEAVFKAVRSQITSDPIHYFSHYEASKAYQGDCELRVSQISQNTIEERALVSREQKLLYFIKVLQRAIHLEFLNNAQAGETNDSLEQHFLDLTRSRSLQLYRSNFAELYKRSHRKKTDSELLQALTDSLRTMSETERKYFQANFHLETQKRIALDVLKHLLTEQGHKAFNTLFDHALSWRQLRLAVNIERNCLDKDDEPIYEAINQLPYQSISKARRTLAKLERTDDTYRYDDARKGSPTFPFRSTLLRTLDTFIAADISRILLRLPYLDLLKEALIDKGVLPPTPISKTPALPPAKNATLLTDDDEMPEIIPRARVHRGSLHEQLEHIRRLEPHQHPLTGGIIYNAPHKRTIQESNSNSFIILESPPNVDELPTLTFLTEKEDRLVAALLRESNETGP
jgi:hypothetical protein